MCASNQVDFIHHIPLTCTTGMTGKSHPLPLTFQPSPSHRIHRCPFFADGSKFGLISGRGHCKGGFVALYGPTQKTKRHALDLNSRC